MGKARKQGSKANGNGANLGFEEKLWAAADKLRGHMDEQQRRWVAGREARRRGHGGIQQVAEITGLHPETIRIGRDELEQDLEGQPTDRVRRPGGGRPCVEKKILPS